MTDNTTPPWTPVWADIPPHYETVLVSYTYVDPTADVLGFWVSAGFRCEDGTWRIMGEDDGMEGHRVVAWMDLPEPAYAVLQRARVVDTQPAKVCPEDDERCKRTEAGR